MRKCLCSRCVVQAFFDQIVVGEIRLYMSQRFSVPKRERYMDDLSGKMWDGEPESVGVHHNYIF